MSAFETRHASMLNRRLQIVLLLLIAWEALGFITELSFGGSLFKISGDEIGGYLAARGSFSGASLVLIALYFWALVRGPVRHPGVLWLAAIEQGAGAFLALYHAATGDLKAEGIIAPMVIEILLLVLILVHLPRGQTAV